MALRNPPSWLQQGSHPAENDRLTWQQLFSNTGVINSGDFQVTQSLTPAMSVLVAGGGAAIIGTTQSNMGVYLSFNDAPVTLTVTAAHPTLPRIDLVYLNISDAAYGGGTNTVTLVVLAGTPNASPVTPTLPANSLALATIAVAALATSIVNANITDVRTRTSTYELVAGTGDPTHVPFTIQLASAQSGHSLDIKNSAGVVVGYVDSSGALQGTLLPTGETFNPFLLMGA